ncbi:MAG: hypothetical protein JSS42_06850 [Proteobacteria bacterium]|uniref:hypothetical protein n=1 Tax=Rudaea sp. TaxID=2136325 RepID=UPI00321FC7B2|nr:hypothetical protein [Pseudomonadota bacterium]
MHKILLAALLAGLSNVASADVVYHLDLNHPAIRIVSFEVAPRGSDRFHPVPVRIHAQDPEGTVTVALHRGSGGCMRDLRIGFADGRRAVRRDFDVCKLASVRAGENLLLAAQP